MRAEWQMKRHAQRAQNVVLELAVYVATDAARVVCLCVGHAPVVDASAEESERVCHLWDKNTLYKPTDDWKRGQAIATHKPSDAQ